MQGTRNNCSYSSRHLPLNAYSLYPVILSEISGMQEKIVCTFHAAAHFSIASGML